MSGYVLRKKEHADINAILRNIEMAVKNAELELRTLVPVEWDESEQRYYGEINIADTFEDIPEAEQWLMYVFSYDECCYEKDYELLRNRDLMRIMFIERFEDNPRILLDFLYEYFKICPEEYFWDGYNDWYFTYKEISEIKERPFNPEWCSIDPKKYLNSKGDGI